jgi:peptidoglycan-associated lipoprotein
MAAPTGPTAEELAAKALQEAKDKFVNEDINFEFDKSVLLPEAQDILRSKAKFLQDNPDIKTTIEGHCDERGTNDYNMALGDRRANSAKQFLIDLGIDAARLDTISYGEEKPVDAGHNEEAWAKNRRDHFIIK